MTVAGAILIRKIPGAVENFKEAELMRLHATESKYSLQRTAVMLSAYIHLHADYCQTSGLLVEIERQHFLRALPV
jgi:hypothetical protein